MGAINYQKSDYITLAIKPYYAPDLENDPVIMKEIIEEVEEYGGTVENAINDYIWDCYAADYENIKAELDIHDFCYFSVSIKPGYYEGFALCIEDNYSEPLNSWTERREINKEITDIKLFLIACAGMGMVECIPGWCSAYNDYIGTLKAIEIAVKEMRNRLKSTPVCTQYERG